MPLTLEQYATYLDSRDLPWPAPPTVEPLKAKPHLVRFPAVRAVTWNVYGTLLAISTGDLLFEHPKDFIMEVALDKTLQEFNMWASMPRKPGQPAAYLKKLYADVFADVKAVAGGGKKDAEVQAERVWEAVIKKMLLPKGYKFDSGFFGSLNEYSAKIAYFFHASLQGTACYAGAREAMQYALNHKLAQALIADGQCFTGVQLQRGLKHQDPDADLSNLVDADLNALSWQVGFRKPSERLFRHTLDALSKKNITPDLVLHVGSRINQDIVPAKKLGMKTALFVGDAASAQVTPEQLRTPASRPDILLTELSQIAEVLSSY